jgi:hypothetical protein
MARRDDGPERRPQDKLFIDFNRNWREMISQSPDFAAPVVRPEQPMPPTPEFEPIVISECVRSTDAGAVVPQVTLSWNETAGGGPDIVLAAQRGGRPPTAQQPPAAAAPPSRLRVDLAIHHNGLGRNYYTTAFSDQKLQRFQLPSTSALVKDEPAVRLTGTGIFPRLLEFRIESLRERETQAQFEKHTLVLRDLNPGVSYTISIDRPAGNQWNEARRFVFLSPVCTQSF